MIINPSKFQVVYLRGTYVLQYPMEDGTSSYVDHDGNLVRDLDEAKQFKCIHQDETTSDNDGSIHYYLDETLDEHREYPISYDQILLRVFLEISLFPAYKIYGGYNQILEQIHITCLYEGKTYRVVGGSTMGDLWLNKNPNCKIEDGYTIRVMIGKCSEWKSTIINK